jgi:hypothetical protein
VPIPRNEDAAAPAEGDGGIVLPATDVDEMTLRKWAVTGLDEATGLLEAVARLDEAPPLELAECFGAGYDGPAWPVDLERPLLDGALITFRVRPADVVRYRDALRTRLEAANWRYAYVIVPRELAREAALRAKEEERQRTIAEAQRLLDLDPGLEILEEAPADRSSLRAPHEDSLAFRVTARTL